MAAGDMHLADARSLKDPFCNGVEKIVHDSASLC